jgi:hypothetical protein
MSEADGELLKDINLNIWIDQIIFNLWLVIIFDFPYDNSVGTMERHTLDYF